jgi:hypothetical protein
LKTIELRETRAWLLAYKVVFVESFHRFGVGLTCLTDLYADFLELSSFWGWINRDYLVLEFPVVLFALFLWFLLLAKVLLTAVSLGFLDSN